MLGLLYALTKSKFSLVNLVSYVSLVTWTRFSVWYLRMYLMSKIVSPYNDQGRLKHFSFESQHQRLFFLITKSFPTSSSTWTFRTHVSWQSGVDHFLECTICPCFFSFQFFKLSWLMRTFKHPLSQKNYQIRIPLMRCR